jgi:hypothetical protein
LAPEFEENDALLVSALGTPLNYIVIFYSLGDNPALASQDVQPRLVWGIVEINLIHPT